MKCALVNPAVILLVSLLAVFLLPAAAMGGLSGVIELDYNNSKLSQEDTAGNSVSSRSTDFLQRYNLNYAQPLFPTLTLGVGYILEKDLTTTRTNDLGTNSTFIRTSPSADLSFKNPFAHAAVGYSEIHQKTDVTGSPSQANEQNNFTASFGLTRRREDIPSLNVGYSWSHSFDKDHVQFDTVNQGFFLNSRYRPLKQIELRYSGNYGDFVDKLGNTESTSIVHDGRFDYSDAFLNNRLRVYSTYEISLQEQQAKVSGPGPVEVTQQILPLAGLSGSGPVGTDTPPETPSLDTLISNVLLIDGNTTAASGVNIGYSVQVPAPRNMGLDLGTVTELNNIYVWVDQRLPSSISNSFSWAIYVSSDITPLKQWTLWQTVAPAPFGAFDNRFELRFANVKTRFIKVVTLPLASPVPVPGIDINNIRVTEIQAFIIQSVQSPGTTTARGTGSRLEAGAAAKLLKVPNLNYDVNYWELTSALKAGSKRDQLTNRLSIDQRLSRIFAAGAMVTRSDTHDFDGNHLGYTYNASVTLTPLNTLSHTLLFTRITDELGGLKSVSDSVYFTNSATPYRGIGLTLALSQTDLKDYYGQKSTTNNVTAGATIAPNRITTINLYFTELRSKLTSTDNTVPVSIITTETSGVSLSIHPYEFLYLFASYIVTESSRGQGTTQPSRTQTYTLSWTPLFGDLWFSLSASQVLTSVDRGENNNISPQLHWNINPFMTLDAGYELLTTRNYLIRSRRDTVFSTLRVLL